MEVAGGEVRCGVRNSSRGKRMLMTHAGRIIILMVVVLLAMVLLVSLVLIFMTHPHILESLVTSTIHHHTLIGKMILIIHIVGMVGRSL